MANPDLLKKVENYILHRELKPGDKLPSEIELAESLGASRGSLREVISYLALKGILERRTSQGTVIKMPSIEDIANDLVFQLTFFNCGKEELKSARHMLELSMVPSLVNHTTPYQLDTLTRINAKMLAEKKNTGKADDLDLQFHKMLIDITGNRLMKIFSEILTVQFEGKSRPPFANQKCVEDSAKEHQAMIIAISNRDENELSRLLEVHIRRLPV
jgi:GntR family galactonate operon transcriptional repressor